MRARKVFHTGLSEVRCLLPTSAGGGTAVWILNPNGMEMNQNSLKLSSAGDDFELTNLEIDCLKLVANGHRSKDIGQELQVSEREIEILLYCVERKLGARNRLHAIGIAVSQGLIGIDGRR